MKNLSLTEFGKKVKILNPNEQKKIKGGFKEYSRPFSALQNDWIEIDIRREGPNDGKGIMTKSPKLGS